MSLFNSGEKPREQLRMPQESYIQIDQWVDYLGAEQYYWWRKFISWVNRSPQKLRDNHVPYTLESVYKKLGVSQATFYRKVKAIWESGLIEIVEYEPDDRKSQKPKNIIVYDYPFNDAQYEYKPLTKLRDWAKDYKSQSKVAGMKGALLKKLSTSSNHPLNSERVKNPVDNHPLKIETVENSVDSYHPLNSERVGGIVDNHPLNSERVAKTVDKGENCTLSDLRANNNINNLKNIIKERENLLNLSLTNLTVDDIKNILDEFTFSEGEINQVIELIYQRKLFNISRDEVFRQAQYMLNRNGINSRPIYFVKGVEMNLDRRFPELRKENHEEEFRPKVSFYNWLEE